MPNDLENDVDTKDSINNTFISNQLNKTNNIELLKALELLIAQYYWFCLTDC